eukprot:4388686-Alexandrium_andersonii.AAC.1
MVFVASLLVADRLLECKCGLLRFVHARLALVLRCRTHHALELCLLLARAGHVLEGSNGLREGGRLLAAELDWLL